MIGYNNQEACKCWTPTIYSLWIRNSSGLSIQWLQRLLKWICWKHTFWLCLNLQPLYWLNSLIPLTIKISSNHMSHFYSIAIFIKNPCKPNFRNVSCTVEIHTNLYSNLSSAHFHLWLYWSNISEPQFPNLKNRKQVLTRMSGKRNAHVLLVGKQTGVATVEKYMEIPHKVKNRITL